MNKKLKAALKSGFTPPPSRKRDIFINSISYPKATFSEVILSQVGFIRKRVWLLFAGCLCYAFLYGNYAYMPNNVIAGISAILPLLSLCVVTEIYKSMAFNMEEMELACKYNLQKITLMRIGILGTISFAVLLAIVALAGKSDYGTLRNAVYIMVPFLLSSYLSLLIISKIPYKEAIYVCAVVSGLISFLLLISSTNFNFIYNLNFVSLWGISFGVLLGLLTLGIVRFSKKQEELQWNCV